jgi:probable phosphoglycerate mutase
MQARRAAETLRTAGIASIVASPLSRALHTAQIAAEALGLPVETDGDLAEVSFGEQEGRPMGDWYDDWIAGTYTPAGARPSPSSAPGRCGPSTRRSAAPRRCWWWRMARCSARCARRRGSRPMSARPNALPLHLAPPAEGATAWTITPAELAPLPKG